MTSERKERILTGAALGGAGLLLVSVVSPVANIVTSQPPAKKPDAVVADKKPVTSKPAPKAKPSPTAPPRPTDLPTLPHTTPTPRKTTSTPRPAQTTPRKPAPKPQPSPSKPAPAPTPKPTETVKGVIAMVGDVVDDLLGTILHP